MVPWWSLLGCDAVLEGLREGFEQGEAPVVAVDPAVLPARPSVTEVRAWLAHHGLAEIRDERLMARADAVVTVEPEELARAWRTLDRSSERVDDLLAAAVAAAGGSFAPAPRRAFVDATGGDPLPELFDWVGVLSTPSPSDALVAYLEVSTPSEVSTLLRRARIVDPEDGEWDVDARRLEPLPDALLDAIEAHLDAGVLGPRSQVTRAIAAERARRAR